jgi:hypothetical protein
MVSIQGHCTRIGCTGWFRLKRVPWTLQGSGGNFNNIALPIHLGLGDADGVVRMTLSGWLEPGSVLVVAGPDQGSDPAVAGGSMILASW